MFSKNAVQTRSRKDMNLLEFDYAMNIKDVLMAQGYGQICSHIDIVNRYKVKLVIELGMYMGGILSHLIPNLELDNEFSYLGFEILPEAVKDRIKRYAIRQPRCSLVLEDMFSPSNIKRIANSIQNTNGVVYIFCDGGDKPKELLTFSKFMKSGDIISVHDYTFDQTGEIKDSDLSKLDKSFLPLDEQWRKDILWMPTFIKI